MTTRTRNHILMILVDIVVTYCSKLIAIALVYGQKLFALDLTVDLLIETPIFIIVLEIFMFVFRLGRVSWRYAGFRDIAKIALATGYAILLDALGTLVLEVFFGYDYRICSSSVYIVFAVFLFILLLFARIFIKEYLVHMEAKGYLAKTADSPKDNYGNVMLIGCGSASMAVLGLLQDNGKYPDTKVICIIDDDRNKLHQIYSGVPVVGPRSTIVENARRYKINTIIFGIAACDPDVKNEIFNICSQTDCQLKTVPTLNKILSGEMSMSTIKNIEIEDLLEREIIQFDFKGKDNYLRDRVVLVTGGGGSIGSELCRQIAKRQPKTLIIFDIYENNAYDIQNELIRQYPDLHIVTLIGSVRDIQRLECIFEQYHPQIVFHAAAHKHVPLMEDSPHESIKNNVFGTYNTAITADKFGVKRFVLISTDKAVNPTNIMGASKRICEMVVQYFSRHSKTEFVAVRFGNVLGSNGSVIPLFKKQIENGGPVTVTHPDIIRYFMTIPEAVSLVLEAGADARGGEIFVLDMGEPVKILKLAENMIRLSGFIPYETMKIEFSGLRPGEKLYEELLMDEEGLRETDNKLIYIGSPVQFEDEQFRLDLKQLKELAYDESSDIRKAVSKLVPTYHYKKPAAEIQPEDQ